ncbi:hypothetical protein BDB00DRAFT_972643 [Zychaea mexicana]|uniref:uncharacterized protein n=1 Tax=Zychaea mexicana TaxID=64656 RepID=UPI0022FE8A55|nr:uncharacterized protein BDB00DRAFT_972643 [Zychaea mexicana]KAI9495670.1 hypothetical protein BDB00DRAFT_972643 [Zychaea mexicana]
MGGEIMQVNYQDENKLRQAMKNARCVFLIPENSSQRMKEAENVIKAAKQENVEHMAMKSMIGVEHIKQQDRERLRHMHEYHQIEQKLKQEFKGEKHCVIRTPINNQLFYLMTPMAEEKQALCLPVKKDAKFGCVDLRDVVDAIANLVREKMGQPSFASQKQMYQFTPPQNFKGEEIARGMAMVVDKSPEEFKFQQIDKKEWQKYMRERREDHRFKERPQEEQGTEKPYTMPIGRYFNDDLVEMLYEWFELASQGHADVTTKDLQEVLQHEPRDLQEYFKSNRDQFRRFR